MGLLTVDMLRDFRNSINGELTSTKETRHSVNPATDQPNPPVPVSTRQDVDNAMNAAEKAFKTWQKTTWQERKERVLAFGDTIESHGVEFAKLLTLEQGKPVSC